jgi:hypothetical protein
MDGRTGSTQFAAEGKRGETASGRLALIDYNPKSCWNLRPAQVEATCLPARAVPAGLLVGTGDDEVPVPVGPETPAPAPFPGLVEVPKPGQTTS